MLDPEIHGAFIQAAKSAGFTVQIIRNGEVTWSGKAPSDAKFQSILMDANRTNVKAAILAQITSIGNALVAKYPATERQGWPQKRAEAQAVTDGTLDAKDAPLLGIEASLTGEDVGDLAQATLTTAQITDMIPAITAGLRRRLENGIAAAKTEPDLTMLQTKANNIRDTIMDAFVSDDPATIKTALAEVS